MADLSLTRKEFLHLSLGAAAVTLTGCPGDDTGSDSTTSDGTTGDPTTSPSTTASTAPTTSPSTTDGTSTGEPETGSTTSGGTTGGTTGEPGTGSTTGGGTTETGGSSSGGAAVDCSDGANDTLISGNHGHAVTIPAGMLQAGTPITGIDIGGASDHTHFIDLTADDVDALLAEESVTVTSTSANMHTHMVTVSC